MPDDQNEPIRVYWDDVAWGASMTLTVDADGLPQMCALRGVDALEQAVARLKRIALPGEAG